MKVIKTGLIAVIALMCSASTIHCGSNGGGSNQSSGGGSGGSGGSGSGSKEFQIFWHCTTSRRRPSPTVDGADCSFRNSL